MSLTDQEPTYKQKHREYVHTEKRPWWFGRFASKADAMAAMLDAIFFKVDHAMQTDYDKEQSLKQVNYAPNVVNHNRKLDEQNADRAKFNSVVENENSKIRPDADGILTFGEANGWRRWGKGQPLYVDFSKIDLGNITMADFKKTKTSVQGNPSILVKFDGKNYVNKTQALVYGTITLVKIGSNKVMAMPDNYNFDMKYTPESTYRDIGTLLGLYLTPAGMPFPIYFIIMCVH